MTISYQANGEVLAASKSASIRFGKDILINDYVVPGAGEYDVAGVQCETHSVDHTLAYFLRMEDLVLTFMHNATPDVASLDDASSTNILILDIRSDTKNDDVKVILKRLEPSYLLLIGEGATPEFSKSLGLTAYEGNQLKITASSLPEEGSWVVNPA